MWNWAKLSKTKQKSYWLCYRLKKMVKTKGNVQIHGLNEYNPKSVQAITMYKFEGQKNNNI